MCARLALLLALAFAASPAAARSISRRSTAPARPARTTVRPVARAVGRRAPRSAERDRRSSHVAQVGALERARALLASVKRDPAKRRFRHHWERAIRALVAAAKGRDTPAALLEAARARYGLFRFSAVESDREEALRLAARAGKLGARDATAFAAAIRHEAGDEPATGARAARKPATATASANTTASEDKDNDEDADDDADDESNPVLETAVSDVPDGESSAPGKAAATDGEPSRVSEVKTWSNTDYTRVAIYLSRSIGVEKTELAPEGDRPRRLALDLRPASLEGSAMARPVGGTRVERVRAAQHDADTVRVVLDLPGDDAYQLFSLDDPPRLIVDVGTREAQRAAQASALPAPGGLADGAPASAAEDDSDMHRRPVRRIVVDAGHGGHDTGAIGPRGVREKDVVLAMAKRLATKLRGQGFQVVLTRSDDVFLPLEERTAIANAARADLFVSIHANAHPRRDRNGVETYFLNVTDDRYAARLAARENGALSPEAGEGREVRRILADLDAKASAESSLQLARTVQRQICSGVRDRIGEVRDLGVKSALFYVLIGARMPAVLVETAFISNRDEERRLASGRYQEEVASDIARAVTSYAGREARVAALGLRERIGSPATILAPDARPRLPERATQGRAVRLRVQAPRAPAAHGRHQVRLRRLASVR